MGYDVSMIDGHIDAPKGPSDWDIIKAVDLCLEGDYYKIMKSLCSQCPYYKDSDCKRKLHQDTTDLLKRLKGDNELKRVKIEKLQRELAIKTSRK